MTGSGGSSGSSLAEVPRDALAASPPPAAQPMAPLPCCYLRSASSLPPMPLLLESSAIRVLSYPHKQASNPPADLVHLKPWTCSRITTIQLYAICPGFTIDHRANSCWMHYPDPLSCYSASLVDAILRKRAGSAITIPGPSQPPAAIQVQIHGY